MDDFNAKGAALDAIREMAKKALADRVKKKAEMLSAAKAPAPEEAMEGEIPPDAAGLSDEDLQALLEEYGKGA